MFSGSTASICLDRCGICYEVLHFISAWAADCRNFLSGHKAMVGKNGSVMRQDVFDTMSCMCAFSAHIGQETSLKPSPKDLIFLKAWQNPRLRGRKIEEKQELGKRIQSSAWTRRWVAAVCIYLCDFILYWVDIYARCICWLCYVGSSSHFYW